MFTNPTHTAPPSVSAPTSPPTSPTRRLRGLSYLRSYTSGNNRSSLRARSPPVTQTEALRTSPSISTDSIAAPNSHTPAVVTSGWLPTQRGPVSRVSILEDNVASSRPVTGIASTSAQPALSISTSTAANNTTLVPRLPNYETMTRNRTEQSASAPPAPTILPLPPPAGQTPPSIRFIPHHDPRASRPSLSFPSVSRTLPTLDSVIRVGRYSERDGPPDVPPHIPSSTPVGFKSKVVSRRHCEFWCENSQWYIKDVKSSSGTFLNHLRLSPPGVESKPWPVNDGDVVQLGIDFRGGEEMIFRCVKIRIECNRGWQKALNNFK
jgi:E3 ubiquitin-protein ligase DMA1/2